MSATKHLAFQKFEPVDMAFRSAITPLRRESGANRGIIGTDPGDKTGEFSHMARFGSVEPEVQCLRLAGFEHRHKLLAQEVDGTAVLLEFHLLNLVLLRLSSL